MFFSVASLLAGFDAVAFDGTVIAYGSGSRSLPLPLPVATDAVRLPSLVGANCPFFGTVAAFTEPTGFVTSPPCRNFVDVAGVARMSRRSLDFKGPSPGLATRKIS